MKILSIDPGYDRLGLAVVEKQNNQESLIYSTCLETERESELADRLLVIGETLEKLLKEHNPDAVAIETLFFNKNQKTAMGVAQMRGIAIYLAKKYKCEVMEYGPQAIKVAITGHGGSDKQAVTTMLHHLLPNLPTDALDDEYDAIAVGVTALAHAPNHS